MKPTPDAIAACWTAAYVANLAETDTHTACAIANDVTTEMLAFLASLEYPRFSVGDRVRPRPGCSPLRSGAEEYAWARVVKVANPFTLVSDDGTMTWSCTRYAHEFERVKDEENRFANE